jgi:tripartite-type tricarboxylate transporter receptor subunit TctC
VTVRDLATIARRKLLLAAAATLAAPAAAETYPSRNLRLIVPYPPGGIGDLTARLLAEGLGEILPVSMVIENRGGGATVTGTQAIATAPRDGYTLGLVDNAFTTNPSLLTTPLPYDPLRDFSFIGLVASAPLILAVHPSVGVDSVPALVAHARQAAAPLTFGSAGNGTPVHIAGELFRRATGITYTHVPYRGAGPMMTDLIAGNIQMAFATVPTAVQHARAGRIRVLAVSGQQRLAFAPEVVSMAEVGVPDFNIQVRLMFIGPADLSPEIVTRLADAMQRSIGKPETRDRLAALGLVPVGGGPDELRRLVSSELEQMARVLRQANIRVE